MHSLGTSQELCLDFLKKHIVALNLSKGKNSSNFFSDSIQLEYLSDKAKLIRDNVYRMYHETQLWGARHV